MKKREGILWVSEKIRIGDLTGWPENPRRTTDKQKLKIVDSIDNFGQVSDILVSPSLKILDGHQRVSALKKTYGEEYVVSVRRASREMNDDERRAFVLALHAGAVGEWDWDLLSGWDDALVSGFGFDEEALKRKIEDKARVSALVTNVALAKIVADGGRVPVEWNREKETTLVCPYCGHLWEMDDDEG